jgi:hypothetical protein
MPARERSAARAPAAAHAEDRETVCEPRERASAIIAMLLALLLALGLVIAAMLAGRAGGMNGAGGGGRAGIGAGSGTGIGGADGTGTGSEGSGPGRGTDGEGRFADGPTDRAQPPGDPDAPEMADAEGSEDSIAAAEAPEVEPPKFGFTASDDPVPPAAASTPSKGVPGGRRTRGASGAAGGKGSEFMGVAAAATDVVYVIDFSGSMSGMRLDHTKLELKRSIERLPPDGSFLVIFFDHAPTVQPPGRLLRATPSNKAAAKRWIDSMKGGGGTDPTHAMQLALTLKPGAIFLMTDGQFSDPETTERTIATLNADKRTSVNTIAFHERATEEYLKGIAQENRGDYRYVPPPGIAAPP